MELQFVLTGKVTGVDSRSGIVEVAEYPSNKIYACYHNSFKSKPKLEHGDTITLIGDQVAHDKVLVKAICGVELPSTVESFKSFVIRFSKEMDGFRAQALYDELTKMAEIHHRVSAEDMMSYISDCYVTEKNTYLVEKFSMLTYKHNDRILPLMTPKQSQTLLSMWSWLYNRRKLLAMGLTEKEVNESGYSDYDLLTQLKKNPYLVPSIDREKCAACDVYTGRQRLESDIPCHAIKRKMYFDVYKRGYTCTRRTLLYNLGIDRWSDKLIELYEVVADDIRIYGNEDSVGMSKGIGTEKVYYLPKQHLVEKGLYEMIKKRVTDKPYYNLGEPVFTDPRLDENQRESVRNALKHNISIITGPAGSGKTTTLKEICKNLEMNGIKYAVTSFTGKAVVRTKQLSGIGNRAATMHRMLSGKATNSDFNYLIIDEATMTASELMYDFLQVYPHNFPILLIGDVNQLQPIDWGSFFGSCIGSRCIPTIKLTNIHRVVTSDGYQDGIIKNSCNIANWPDGAMYVFHTTPNFNTLECKHERLAEIIMKYKEAGVNSLDVTIVCPYRASHGVPELNQLCQLIWCAGNKMITKTQKNWVLNADDGEKRWIVGGRVMMLKNNYDIDVYNGQEGIITDVDEDGVSVNFPFTTPVNVKPEIQPDAPCLIKQTGACKVEGTEMVSYDRIVKFLFNPERKFSRRSKDKEEDSVLDIENISLSYVISVHKSQGSEWPHVMYFMPETANLNSSFICRPLTYVAITRGSKMVWVVGSVKGAIKSISRPAPYRCDMLKNRIINDLPRLYNYEVKEFKFDKVDLDQADNDAVDDDDDDDWEDEENW